MKFYSFVLVLLIAGLLQACSSSIQSPNSELDARTPLSKFLALWHQGQEQSKVGDSDGALVSFREASRIKKEADIQLSELDELLFEGDITLTRADLMIREAIRAKEASASK